MLKHRSRARRKPLEPSPAWTVSGEAPPGATAQCADGAFSFSARATLPDPSLAKCLTHGRDLAHVVVLVQGRLVHPLAK